MSKVLFLGEGNFQGPAKYLAGILRWARIPFDHRPDQAPIPPSWQSRHYDAFILSDYRHASFSARTERWIADEVRTGSGLLMIGGWASFTGLLGKYKGSLLESLLPVRCLSGDDRVHCSSGSLVVGTTETSKLFKRLDFNKSPIVCGYHRTRLAPGAKTLLALRDLRFKKCRPVLGIPHPLLVVGSAGRGRTAALLTDCAPHWAGGWVDWGENRLTVKIQSGCQIEVGNLYLSFFSQLIHWVSR